MVPTLPAATRSKAARTLAAVPLVLAGAQIALWVVLVALRVGYPFELEWMEGGMLDHILRVRAGEALYGAPSLEFAAFPYTPGFPLVAAPAVGLAGEGFSGPRCVSVLATVGVLLLVARVAAQLAGADQGRRAGLLAAGLFAAGYGFTGAWFDIARVDSLACFFAMAGLALALGRRSTGAWLGAALCGALACLTKQTYISLAVATGAVVLHHHGLRQAGLYGLILAGTLGGAVVALERATEGWFLFTTVDLLRAAPQHAPSVVGFWRECALALGPAALCVLLAVAQRRLDVLNIGWFAVVSACIAAGWIGRAHEGGFENNLIPPLLAAALLFGPAAARSLAERPRSSAWLAAVALLALAYDPRPLIPSQADRAAGERLVARIAELEPPVFLPDHGYLLRRAFGPDTHPGIHGMAINDLLKSGHDERARELVTALEDALRARRFGAVVLDERWEGDLPALAEHYQPPLPLWAPNDTAFLPVTGAPKRPTWLYLRR